MDWRLYLLGWSEMDYDQLVARVNASGHLADDLRRGLADPREWHLWDRPREPEPEPMKVAR